jgi:hypothetical protein
MIISIPYSKNKQLTPSFINPLMPVSIKKNSRNTHTHAPPPFALTHISCEIENVKRSGIAALAML